MNGNKLHPNRPPAPDPSDQSDPSDPAPALFLPLSTPACYTPFMPLGWTEIKTRAIAFSREWAGETRETAETPRKKQAGA